MSTLGFDFSHSAGPASILGWVALLLGLAASGWVVRGYLDAERRHHELERQLTVVQSSWTGDRLRETGPIRAAENKLEADADRRLGQPWAGLMSNLDQARGTDIGFIALEADGRSGRATLRAEARDAEAMAAFYQRLEKSDAFREVELVEHEIKNGSGYNVVRFTLHLAWGQP